MIKVVQRSLVVLIPVAMCLLSTPSYASFPYNNEIWVNAGLGAGTGNNDNVELPNNIPPIWYSFEKQQAEDVSGPAAEISLNAATTPNQLLTLRYYGQSNLFADPGDGYLQEVGLLYGLMAKAQYGYASASAGISYVNVGYRSGTDGLGVTFNNPSNETVGLPAEVQLFLTPCPYFGIGIVGVGDYNSRAPVAAGLVELQIGKLS